MLYFAIFLAFLWGAVWAAFLQFSKLGRFLVTRHTWITVVVGVGVDLLIALMVIPFQLWGYIALIFTCSSVGIIFRSIHNELRDSEEVMEVSNGG